MAFRRCGQRSFHGSLRVALIGSALVRRKCPSLAVSQLGFLELGHSTMPASSRVKVDGSFASLRSRRTNFAIPDAEHSFVGFGLPSRTLSRLVKNHRDLTARQLSKDRMVESPTSIMLHSTRSYGHRYRLAQELRANLINAPANFPHGILD